MPQILLEQHARCPIPRAVFQHAIKGMTAAHTGGFHAARGRKIRRPQADAVHARAGRCDLGHIIHPLRRFQNGMDQDWFCDFMTGFELRQQLVQIMNVPRSFHLGQHDHIQLIPHRADNFRQIIQHPGRIQAVDAGPQARIPELHGCGHLDKTGPGGFFGVGGNGVLQIAQQHIHLPHHIRDLGAHLFHMRREKVNHTLQRHRNFPIRLRRPDGQWFEKIFWRFSHFDKLPD